MDEKQARKVLARARELDRELAALDVDLELAHRDSRKIREELGSAETARRLGGESDPTVVTALRAQLAERLLDVEMYAAARPSLEAALLELLDPIVTASEILGQKAAAKVREEIAGRQEELRAIAPRLVEILARFRALGGLPGLDAHDGRLVIPRVQLAGVEMFERDMYGGVVLPPDAAERERVERALADVIRDAAESEALRLSIGDRCGERHRQRELARRREAERLAQQEHGYSVQGSFEGS
jgi:hypothetical protein